MLYMLKPGVAEKIRKFVASGGTFVMTYWSAMVDENTRAIQGGYPGDLRDVFGIWVEETDCLYDSERVRIESTKGNSCDFAGQFDASQYCELLHLEGAEPLANYASEFYAGRPCVTRNDFGEGEAFFVASRNDDAFQREFLNMVVERAGLLPALETVTPPGVTVQVRHDEKIDYVFILNFSGEPQEFKLEDSDLLDLEGKSIHGSITLETNGFKVLSRLRSSISCPTVEHQEAGIR